MNCPRPVHYVGFLPVDMSSRNPWFNTAAIQFEKIKQHIQTAAPEKTEELKMLFTFLFRIFQIEGAPYALTSWLADHLLYHTGIDFIVYPSYQTQSWQCKMAFHPNFADLYFHFHRVFEFRMNHVTSEGGNFTITRMGKIHFSEIAWSPAPGDEVQQYFPAAVEQVITH